MSRLIKPGDTTKGFLEKTIQFHKTFHGLKIRNWNHNGRHSYSNCYEKQQFGILGGLVGLN